MSEPAEIVEKYFDLFATQRYAETRPLLADRFSFDGPIDTFTNPDDFIAAVSKLAGITKAIHKKKVFSDGQDVCIIYDFECGPPLNTTVPITEWFHVENGKIDAIKIMFDPRPFTAMFQHA